LINNNLIKSKGGVVVKLSEREYQLMKNYEKMADLYMDYMKKIDELEKRIADGTETSDPDGGAMLRQFGRDLENLRQKCF